MRDPDFIIGSPDAPYLRRWWVIPRNKWFNIYLHNMLRDDDDRALHDHPWWNVSIILKGGYHEVMPRMTKYRKSGSIIPRLAKASHRLELWRQLNVDGTFSSVPAWSLFITGPRFREWGFHCPKGWVHWKDFTSPANKGEVGRGCD